MVLEYAKAPTPAAIKRMRVELGNEATRWVGQFAQILPKLQDKLGDGFWLGTQRAAEQASDRWTAHYKAARFPSGRSIVDICSGVGGDAIALRQRGPVVAIDSDPVMAAVVAYNLQSAAVANTYHSAVVCVKAEDLPDCYQQSYVHLDPDRRADEKRHSDPQGYLPDLETMQRLVDRSLGTAIKLAPAAEVPDSWEEAAELEWISCRGSVRQQVAWFGDFPEPVACGGRRATRVYRDREPVTFFATAEEYAATSWEREYPVETVASADAWLIDLDPAVRAAGLTVAFAVAQNLQLVGGPAGFLTSAAPPPHPLAVGYEVLWRGSADMKAIKRAAVQQDVRLQEIKVRGSDLRPEKIRPKLADKKGQHRPEATLLIHKTSAGIQAAIGRRQT
ncbi:class I SAM-dependent methyltransferase [Roseimaritima multifibrata]|nr:class I SAM-dependent methyltransferase [Roseimaritima multifibrata]